jgi:hypothetical protein
VAGNLAVRTLAQQLKGRWFEYLNRQREKSVSVPLSKTQPYKTHFTAPIWRVTTYF